jgi:Fic family protein
MIYSLFMMQIILESLRNELLTRSPLDALPDGVWKRTSALNTWGTNAIEGNTLIWSDVEKLLLKEKSVANRPTRDVLETIQHDATFRGMLILRSKPISLALVQDLHEAIFRGVKEDAGQCQDSWFEHLSAPDGEGSAHDGGLG